MDFFNSLAQVAKNNKNFKTWEEKQNDTQARREELNRRRQYSAEEIESAKQLGERIIDVVDIMDNHSENVAENVETAVQPIVGLAPLIPAVAGFVYFVKKILKPAQKGIYNIEEKLLWNNDEARTLAREITDDIHKTRPNKEGFYEYHFSSKHKIDKVRNPKLRARAMEIYNEYVKQAKPFNRKIKGGIWGVIGVSVLSFIGANIYAAKLQVDSSKIARFQARKILDDPKAFVNYTPEQIEAAKKYIEDHPELKKQKKKEKLNSGMIKSIYNVLKDRKEYLRAQKADTDESKKVTRALTSEEQIKAKKDQEIIQRSVRIINNEAEKYSENMEVAAGVILGSTPIVGGLIGWLTGLLMNKTGLTDKMVSGIVNKHGSEHVKAAYARFKELKPGAPGYSIRWSKFVGKLMDDDIKYAHKAEEIVGEGINKGKKSLKTDVLQGVKKAFAAGMSHKWFNSKIIGLAGALLSSIPASLIALKLQKSSARAGRYTAKRELEKDPKNFIGYTEEDYKEVEDVKGKKQTFGQKFKEYALFIPTVLKQYYAYDKYKRTEFKEHQLLMDELKKADISDEQLRDAKNLQRKLFNTFEKVDDNSQIYSESMEAAIEILQPFAMSAGVLTMISPIIYGVVQFKRGKLTAASILDKTIDKLSKASNFLKSKKIKKYLNDVADKVPHKVGNFELEHKPVAALMRGLDFKNDTIGTLGAKLIANIKASSAQFRFMDDSAQQKLLGKIESSIKNSKEFFDYESPQIDSLLKLINRLKSEEFTSRLRADMLDIAIKNTDVISRMPDANFNAAMMKYADLLCDSIGEDNIAQLAKNLPELAEKFPDMADFIYKFANRYNSGANDMTIFDINAFKKAFVSLIDKKEYAEVSSKIDARISKVFSSENFPYKLSDIPNVIDEIIERMNKFAGQKANPTGAKALSGKAGEEAAESVAQAFIRKYSNPAEYVKALTKEIEKMTPEEFQAIADARRFSSMDKATMLKILPNIEKILNNIPKDELNKIGQTLLKEFKEHPDEFIKALRTGQLATVFMTDSLVRAAATVGVSWVALNIALIWTIQTWLADIQLKAGRLGVMKAIESLEDPAYYADIEPDKKISTAPVQKAVNIPENPLVNGNFLDKFKK